MPHRAPSPPRPQRAALWPVAWLLAAAMLHPSQGKGQTLEYAVKATYLHKFTPFVEWPSPVAEFPGGAFTFCVVGDDPLDGLLERAMQGQQVDGRPIAIRRFDHVSGNPGCSVMYVTGTSDRVAADLAAVRGMPILTVTDSATEPAATGIINFVLVDDRVRFGIDNAAAAAGGLSISSKLLSLAVHVTGKSQ